MTKQKRPTKISRSKRVHLVHHRHTARLLHKRHTSYPLVLLLLMCVGVFMIFATIRVGAEDITVTGNVPEGPKPTIPATILNPTNGQVFTSVPIVVSGTCDPGFIVKIYRNNLFSGSAMCTTTGQFSLSLDLFPGANELRARIFNVVDKEGPQSPTVTVSYSSSAGEPFYIASEFLYYAVASQKNIKWAFWPVGGTGPYTIRIIWGDGYSEERTNLGKDGSEFEHAYGPPPNQREYYPINITLIDADGRQAYLQVFTIVNDKKLEAAFNNTTGGVTRVDERHLLLYIWPAYIITGMVGFAFWLGERRGLAMSTRLPVRRIRRV
jgi:hypothetical protein